MLVARAARTAASRRTRTQEDGRRPIMTLTYNGTGTDSIVIDQADSTIIVKNHGTPVAASATTTSVSIAAGAGNDTVLAHHAPLIGHVTIGGGAGNDKIVASADSTVSIDGGADNDTV